MAMELAALVAWARNLGDGLMWQESKDSGLDPANGSEACHALADELERLAAENARLAAAEARRTANRCEDCGSTVSSYRNGCPGCGAPQCCKACCDLQNADDRIKTLGADLERLAAENERWAEAWEGVRASCHDQWSRWYNSEPGAVDAQEARFWSEVVKELDIFDPRNAPNSPTP